MSLTVSDVPAGLVLVPRHIDGLARPVWDITHRASQMQVIKDCITRDHAITTAVALGGCDWERDADAIKADPTARAVYLAVQAQVLDDSMARTK